MQVVSIRIIWLSFVGSEGGNQIRNKCGLVFFCVMHLTEQINKYEVQGSVYSASMLKSMLLNVLNILTLLFYFCAHFFVIRIEDLQ